MDDFLSGAESYETLVLLRSQVTEMVWWFSASKMDDQQSTSRAREFNQLPDQSVALQLVSGVLGMVWLPGADQHCTSA